MLFVFFYHNTVNVAEPGNSAIVDPSSGEMPPNWSDILVHIRVFILFYAHFSLYFGGGDRNQTCVVVFAER